MRVKEQSRPSGGRLFLVVLGLLGVLAAITLITVLSLQPLRSDVLGVILIYVFIFLGLGIVSAAIVSRLVDRGPVRPKDGA